MNEGFTLNDETGHWERRGESVERRRMSVQVPSGPTVGIKLLRGWAGGPQGSGPSAAIEGLAPSRRSLEANNGERAD